MSRHVKGADAPRTESVVRVSTVIVSYNRVELLHRAVQSALDQTVRDAEVIVVDNCSKFDIHEAMARYGDAVRAIRTERNLGCGPARNVGVRIATGDFVAFLDDDDYWKPNKLERQLQAIGNRPMVVCGQETIPRQQFNVLPVSTITQDMLRVSNLVCPPSGFLCRRDLFEKMTFDETIGYGEDWDFMLRALDFGEIGYVAEPLLYYTVNTGGGSMTSASKGKTWDEIQYRFASADKHRSRLGEWSYRKRVALITLAHIGERPDRLTFIKHSIGKAGVAATVAALGQRVLVKVKARFRPAQSGEKPNAQPAA
jgi:GalNAc5-diNAcBac-PP-undecaprenol beta-1,3-glucosyltransferase